MGDARADGMAAGRRAAKAVDTNPENIDLTEDRGFVMGVGVIYGLVCVPKSWSDEQILDFIDDAVGAPGTTGGWVLSTPDANADDTDWLAPRPAREQCPDEESRVHVLFNC